MSTSPNSNDGKIFDSPLLLHGAIDDEPQRYIAEKPYELTKFEFAVLRKRSYSEFWVTLVAGATAGIGIAVLGKVLAALLEKKTPTLDPWELWAFGLGFVVAFIVKFAARSKDDKERAQLETVIAGHFIANRPRRVHLTTNQEPK